MVAFRWFWKKFRVPKPLGACSKDILSLLASVPTQSEPWIEPRPGWKDGSGSGFWKVTDRFALQEIQRSSWLTGRAWIFHTFFFVWFFHIFWGDQWPGVNLLEASTADAPHKQPGILTLPNMILWRFLSPRWKSHQTTKPPPFNENYLYRRKFK